MAENIRLPLMSIEFENDIPLYKYMPTHFMFYCYFDMELFVLYMHA